MKNWDREKFLKAWRLVTTHHSGQTYGGPAEGEQLDYLSHIGMVVMEVMWALQLSENVDDPDLALLCAILHDTIEDTELTYDAIQSNFGDRVAEGVSALTKDKSLPTKKAQMEDSLSRIKAQPVEVWMVKMADRISNLYHPPFYWDKTKMRIYQEEAKMIHNRLKEGNAVLANRLEEKINRYQTFFE